MLRNTDGDGTRDFLEFLQNTDPNEKNAITPIINIETNAEGTETKFSWTVHRELNFGIDYEFQISSDLVSWEKPDDSDYTLKTIQAGSHKEKLTATFTNTAETKIFARIGQVPNPSENE